LTGANRVQAIAAESINDERWSMTVALELQDWTAACRPRVAH
jgi:hypothetical protein